MAPYLPNPELGEPRLDPRDPGKKAQDAQERYKRRRLREYPSVRKQLDMMYWDTINGTSTWADEITRVKAKYPKPTE